MTRELIAGCSRLCAEEHDPINAVVKLRVPRKVGQIVNEADSVDPTLGHVTFQACFVPLTGLIDTLRCKGTFNEAQSRVEGSLNDVNIGDKVALAQSWMLFV